MKFKEVKEPFQGHRLAGQNDRTKLNPKESFTILGMSATMPEPVLGLDGDRVEEPLQEPLISLCKNDLLGTSLGIWWLGLSASNAGARLPSLISELRSHMPCCVTKKKKKE